MTETFEPIPTQTPPNPDMLLEPDQPVPLLPENTPNYSKSKFILILVFVLILTSVSAILGWNYLNNNQKNNGLPIINSPTPTPQSAPSAQSTPLDDPLLNSQISSDSATLQSDPQGGLSAFLVQADTELAPLLTYESGQKLGSDGKSNYDDFSAGLFNQTKTVTGVDQYEIDVSAPLDGKYTLTIYPQKTGKFGFALFVYAKNGDSKRFEIQSDFVKTESVNYEFSFKKSATDFTPAFEKTE